MNKIIFIIPLLFLLTACTPSGYITKTGTFANANCSCSYDLMIDGQSAYGNEITAKYWYDWKCNNDTVSYQLKMMNTSSFQFNKMMCGE